MDTATINGLTLLAWAMYLGGLAGIAAGFVLLLRVILRSGGHR